MHPASQHCFVTTGGKQRGRNFRGAGGDTLQLGKVSSLRQRHERSLIARTSAAALRARQRLSSLRPRAMSGTLSKIYDRVHHIDESSSRWEMTVGAAASAGRATQTRAASDWLEGPSWVELAKNAVAITVRFTGSQYGLSRYVDNQAGLEKLLVKFLTVSLLWAVGKNASGVILCTTPDVRASSGSGKTRLLPTAFRSVHQHHPSNSPLQDRDSSRTRA